MKMFILGIVWFSTEKVSVMRKFIVMKGVVIWKLSLMMLVVLLMRCLMVVGLKVGVLVGVKLKFCENVWSVLRWLLSRKNSMLVKVERNVVSGFVVGVGVLMLGVVDILIFCVMRWLVMLIEVKIRCLIKFMIRLRMILLRFVMMRLKCFFGSMVVFGMRL